MKTQAIIVVIGSLGILGCQPAAPNAPASAPITVMPEVAKKPEGTVEEYVARAKQSAELKDYSKAVEDLDQALLLDPKNREVLVLSVEYSAARSKAVADKDPAQAYRSMVTAGGYLRMLKDAYQDLTEDEKKLNLRVLYDEASAHARSYRLEETLGSLREAVGAGFRDFDRLEKDNDWDRMKALPQFQKAYEEILTQTKEK